MSNHLAIATVTATLQRYLQSVVQLDVDGATVSTTRPNNTGGTPQSGVNLFLYHLTPNPVWRNNSEGMARSRRGEIAKRSRTALDLHYLLSFYGNEIELEPQRLLGSVISSLCDQASITKDLIRETISDSTLTYLSESNLSDQLEEINFTPLDLSLEDLSKVWSVFLQTPYSLSVAYKATVVIIEGEESAQKPLPVRQRVYSPATFFNQPVVNEVLSSAGKFQPILINSTLVIKGKNFKAESTQVRISKNDFIPVEVSDTKISLPLASLPANSLQAGVQTLQVINLIATPVLNNRVESNIVPFVLNPVITQVSATNIRSSGDDLFSAEITLQLNLVIGKQQRVVLALNETAIEHPSAYLFDASPQRTDSQTIKIAIRNVKPGEYLVRLQIDGAESPLNVDTNPQSPTFNCYISPKVLIE